MIQDSRRWLLLTVAAAGSIAVAWWIWTADVRQVTAATRDLATLLTVERGEAEIAHVARVAQLGQRLDSSFIATFEDRPDLQVTREDALAYAARVRSAGGITVTADAIEVAVVERRVRAIARASVTAREIDLRGGSDIVEQRDVEVEFVRFDGRWKAARAAVGAASPMTR